MCIINEEFGFNSNKRQTIKHVKESLDSYSTNYESARQLDGNIPIFLDTNILLNYYGMSSIEKEKLLEFIKTTNSLHITKQIENEFIKNRVDVIGDYFTSVRKIKDLIENDLIKNINNKFKLVLDNKILKTDFKDTWQDLETIFIDLKKKLLDNNNLIIRVNNSVDSLLNFNKHLKINDDILSNYQEIEVIKGLNESEIKFLKSEFNKLNIQYKQAKENQKYKIAFPGCGERKNINEADGDFLIYHEILKFMKEKQTDAIFLTNDITKNDWISKDGEPFIHYIEKTFLNSRHNLYIFDAKRLLSTIDFENIYDFDIEEPREIKVKGIFTIKCKECNDVFKIESGDLDLCFLENYEYQIKNGQTFPQVEDAELECSKCNNLMLVTFEFNEYPIGSYNFDIIEIKNGELTEKPSLTTASIIYK